MIICPVCGLEMPRTSPSHILNHGLTVPEFHALRLEKEHGIPIVQFMYDIYVLRRLSSPQIFAEFGITYRMLRKLLAMCEIPLRSRSDATLASWEKDDGTRSEIASQTFREISQRVDYSGDNNPAKRPEVRQKISDAKLKSNPGLMPMLLGHRRLRLSDPSLLEVAMRDALANAGIEFELEFRVGRYFIDIALPEIKVGIECDGRGWHSANIKHDKRRDAWLSARGWHIFRFAQEQIFADPAACVRDLIANLKALGIDPSALTG